MGREIGARALAANRAGDAAAFRLGLNARGMHYVVGISSTLWAQPGDAAPVAEPYSGTGRPPVPEYPQAACSVKEPHGPRDGRPRT
jgi:hypothetical protein